jgi:sec-independent protein translocase protein TatA
MFAFLQGIGPWEVLIVLGVGVLLFGKRLPEVGRSLGKGIVEFKKGLKGVEEEIDEASSRPSSRGSERMSSEAPKFELPSEPTKNAR